MRNNMAYQLWNSFLVTHKSAADRVCELHDATPKKAGTLWPKTVQEDIADEISNKHYGGLDLAGQWFDGRRHGAWGTLRMKKQDPEHCQINIFEIVEASGILIKNGFKSTQIDEDHFPRIQREETLIMKRKVWFRIQLHQNKLGEILEKAGKYYSFSFWIRLKKERWTRINKNRRLAWLSCALFLWVHWWEREGMQPSNNNLAHWMKRKIWRNHSLNFDKMVDKDIWVGVGVSLACRGYE